MEETEAALISPAEAQRLMAFATLNREEKFTFREKDEAGALLATAEALQWYSVDISEKQKKQLMAYY